MDQKHKSNLIITCLCLIIVFVSLLTMYDNFSFHTYNTKTYYDYFLSLNHQGFTLQDYELYKDQSNYHCGDGTLVLGKIDSLVDGQDIDVIIQINRKQHIDYSLKYLEGGSYSLENKEDLKNIKEIKNVRTYVSVDGGMTDNIRPSLYQADYECGIVNKINKTGHNHKVTIAGKCCESGDILISDTEIGDINSGDILITTTTGAYGYSMASNYNKIPKNPVVFVQNGEDKLACKRQSYEDLLALEV